MTTADAYTRELVAAAGVHTNMRQLIHRLERDQEAIGWDQPETARPTLWTVDADRKDRLSHVRADAYTATVRWICDAPEIRGNVGAAMLTLAGVSEQARDMLRAAYHPQFVQNLDRAARERDLVTSSLGAGWHFHGLMFTAEVWMVQAKTEADERMARERRLDEHPDRIETRAILAADRTGHLWHYTRRRGDTLGTGPLLARRVGDTDALDNQVAGDIGHSLQRLVLSVTSAAFRPIARNPLRGRS